MSNVRLLASIRECWHFKILTKGIKVTLVSLVSVPVLPSPPSTVYRRPLGITFLGGGVGTCQLQFWRLHMSDCLIHRGSCVLSLQWLNESFLELWKPSLESYAKFSMAVFNSFKNGFVAYKQQKLSSAARSWNYSVCLCHVGRTAESSKTRQEQKLRMRLPLKGKPVTWLLQMKCHHYG